MDNRSPALARDFPSKPQLLQAIRLIGSEIEKQPLKSSSLARIMRESFGGSDAGGAWSWRMAYDLMQAATVTAIMRDSGSDALATARLLASRLLTESRRSEEQIRLQSPGRAWW